MSLKDVGNKVPIYKLKTTEEVMKYYDEWGKKNKYNKDMVEWNYTGPKETVETFKKYSLNFRGPRCLLEWTLDSTPKFIQTCSDYCLCLSKLLPTFDTFVDGNIFLVLDLYY